jgi:hypothetical protein
LYNKSARFQKSNTLRTRTRMGLSDIPFDIPLSISELALLPRKPVLLLLCPSLLPLRISLFRVMTGVSAKGSMILCAFGSRFFATVSSFCVGVFAPTKAVFCSGCASGAGVICFFLSFSTGTVFLLQRARWASAGLRVALYRQRDALSAGASVFLRSRSR